MTPRRRHRRRPAVETTRAPRVAARVNEGISAASVRLIDEHGEQVGVRPVAEALAYAEERKAREARRNQVHVASKDVRLTPKIGAHDYEWKLDRAVEFLRGHAKVRVTVRFRGREREHPERADPPRPPRPGRAEWGQAEAAPAFDGRNMTLVIAPTVEARRAFSGSSSRRRSRGSGR
ncbi:MAG: hypothetical protein HOQ03_06895 [Thermoleophilia bacterium]|nr:hypothetical protein [Thermoleophilia bacterium]